MKTLKLALVAIFIASTMVSMANADGFKSKPKKSVNITYASAVHNKDLVKAMYLQLDPSFLNNYEQLYVVEVTYDGTVYHILGSRHSWISFFRLKWKFPAGSDTKVKDIR